MRESERDRGRYRERVSEGGRESESSWNACSGERHFYILYMAEWRSVRRDVCRLVRVRSLDYTSLRGRVCMYVRTYIHICTHVYICMNEYMYVYECMYG